MDITTYQLCDEYCKKEEGAVYMGTEKENKELWKEVLHDFIKEGDMPQEIIQKYQRKVPKEVLYLWGNYGCGSFCNGFFKVINPEEYKDIFNKLVDYLDPIVPILVTGMGDIYASEYGKDDKFHIEIYRPRYNDFGFLSGGLPDMAKIYNERIREHCFCIRAYEEAIERYGIPAYENCFAYTIPLVRGGYEDVEHIESLPVKEFLEDMYQLHGQYSWDSTYAPISKKDKDFTYEIHPDTINITKSAIFIGEKQFPAPLDTDKIGEYVKEKGIKGIEAREKEGRLFISFGLSDCENYGGTLLVEGEPWVYAKRKPAADTTQKQMLDQYQIEYWLKSRTLLEWVYITAFDEKRYKAMVEKYKIPKLTEEVLEFKDFNFKLMVIQNLMYEQKVLPEFNLEEFAEQCKNEIDLQSEEPISEVVRYFKKLPIPKSMAEAVTELNADGGDEIYAQISPEWDGEEDWYVVKKAVDVSQFPNLKKVDDEFFTKKAQKELKAYLEQL